MACEVRIVSALEKVFADSEPLQAVLPLSVLGNDVVSFQLACRLEDAPPAWVKVAVASPIGQWIQVREVKLMPSTYPCHPWVDDGNYLRREPGVYPDLLTALQPGERFRLVGGQWRALWVDIEADADVPAGVHTVEISATDEAGAVVFSVATQVEVIGKALPKLDIYHTEWFHADCIADYYGIAPGDDDAFFAYVEKFIRTAARRDINTILTPIFTPPLDTAEGGFRTTTQLVGVIKEGNAFTFDFARLRRWIAMLDACGIAYIEISHLFSQWGARYAPKVMGLEDGEEKMLFGWHTAGTGEAYEAFLAAFLPALWAELGTLGVLERCLFHVSDEPSPRDLESYKAAGAIVRKYLPEAKLVDALSDFDIYQESAVDIPVVANNHIAPFLDAGVPGLWTYYCTSQSRDVSNRFFAMPSARNRILGVQMYLYDVKGFLQWGYNFYNTQFSLRHVNPYAETDAGDAFPSGDAFLVYPGKDGEPEESIRLMVLQSALSDLRALKLLESLTDRAFVEALIYEGVTERITFAAYPKDAAYLLAMRARVNKEIQARIG